MAIEDALKRSMPTMRGIHREGEDQRTARTSIVTSSPSASARRLTGRSSTGAEPRQKQLAFALATCASRVEASEHLLVRRDWLSAAPMPRSGRRVVAGAAVMDEVKADKPLRHRRLARSGTAPRAVAIASATRAIAALNTAVTSQLSWRNSIVRIPGERSSQPPSPDRRVEVLRSCHRTGPSSAGVAIGLSGS